ncbi:MAG: hypothetical protein ACOY5U_12575 [Pseudomonadota bacterium]
MYDASAIETLAAVEGQHDLSSITVTEAEPAVGALSADRLDEARALFARHGYLMVENLFTPEQMRALDTAYRSRCPTSRPRPAASGPCSTAPSTGPGTATSGATRTGRPSRWPTGTLPPCPRLRGCG